MEERGRPTFFGERVSLGGRMLDGGRGGVGWRLAYRVGYRLVL